MTQLYIIRGVSGSGKTTLAEKMLHFGMIDDFFEADMFRIGHDGQYQFDPSQNKMCHEKCQNKTRDALSNGWNVAVSNTFTRKWEMQPYIDMANDIGAQVTMIVCQGEFDNVHGVPADNVQQMRDRFEY